MHCLLHKLTKSSLYMKICSLFIIATGFLHQKTMPFRDCSIRAFQVYLSDCSIKVFCDCFIRIYRSIVHVVQIDQLGGFYGLFTPTEHSFQSDFNKLQDITPTVVCLYRLLSSAFY